MVDEHFALDAEARVATGRAVEHCRQSPSGASTSQSYMPSSPFNPFEDSEQWALSLTSDGGSSKLPYRSFTYERASGGARSVDAITVALSRQHLHNDKPNTLAEVPAAVSSSSLASSPPTDDLTPKVTSSHHQPTPRVASEPQVAALSSPDQHSSASTKEDMNDPPIDRSYGTNYSTRLLRKMPARQSMVINKNQATQALLESMICSETQCNVQGPPLLAPITGALRDFCSMESQASLEVDDIMSYGIDLEEPNFDNLLGARCALKPPGITKGYRSSTETALRCRNLVRSRPRMRKRTRLRDQASSSAMSTAASPTATSTTTVS